MNLTMKVSIAAFVSTAILLISLCLLYQNFRTVKTLNDEDLYSCDNNTVFKCLPQRLAASFYPPIDVFAKALMEPVTVMRKTNSKYDITIIVKSTPSNYLQRDAIRASWGSVTSFKGKSLCVIFIVGLTDNSKTKIKLAAEGRAHGDLLQVDVPDTFQNLPKKSLSAFHWIEKFFSVRSRFYIVTDDDCVIHIANTVKFLIDNDEAVTNSIHCGYMFESNAGVIRGTGKRSVSAEIYPFSIYPKFCRGGMVILSHAYVKKISDAATVTNLTDFHLEDVLLYGILREKLYIPDSIKNVINGGHPLVYHTWDDDSGDATVKMLLKWREWKLDLQA